ncbi:MAG: mycothiol synthase [Acidimicrobiaceae bacterium]|nr:mycothiol synthase [Acidimicrobiaceae bacterium]MYD05868.1 mycothiol synthase [Acidimicrobiaceae bacterium]MYI58533.1 mycothiol synthase [Acidimicrobiaceae bacterium]
MTRARPFGDRGLAIVRSYANAVALTIEGPNEGDCTWSLIAAEDRRQFDLQASLTEWLAAHRDETVQLWLREVDEQAHAIAVALGFEPYRDLWQLRCDLPNSPSGLDTKPFSESDIDTFVAVNNRAFHWHPEQSGLTAAAVRRSMSEPWFNADGFRLLHNDEGRLMGFCWTKIHRDTDPNLGEIYVIAVDPDFHGQGLGKPMTLAGLEWLAAQGLTDGMLYVESDNHAANATYAAIGFSRHHTDRAYRLKS